MSEDATPAPAPTAPDVDRLRSEVDELRAEFAVVCTERDELQGIVRAYQQGRHSLAAILGRLRVQASAMAQVLEAEQRAVVEDPRTAPMPEAPTAPESPQEICSRCKGAGCVVTVGDGPGADSCPECGGVGRFLAEPEAPTAPVQPEDPAAMPHLCRQVWERFARVDDPAGRDLLQRLFSAALGTPAEPGVWCSGAPAQPAPDEGAVEALAAVFNEARWTFETSREAADLREHVRQRRALRAGIAAVIAAIGGEVAALRGAADRWLWVWTRMVNEGADAVPEAEQSDAAAALETAYRLTPPAAAAAVTALVEAAQQAEDLIGRASRIIADCERSDLIPFLDEMEQRSLALHDTTEPFLTAQGGGSGA